MAREKGVATTPCPECGTDLPMQDQPDGSVAAELCPKCNKPPKAERASGPRHGREHGTETHEEE